MLVRWTLATGALCALAMPAFAADHAEAPGTQADPAADIGDYFAWSDGSTVTAILTYSPLLLPGDPGVYDADVLYTLHFDTDGDLVSDHDIHVRFGESIPGMWGVQASNFPGAGVPVSGAIETVIPAPGGHLFAGLRDDPFFFDLTGFNDTLASSTIAFTGDDTLAGANIMVIALEFDAPSLLGTGTTMRTWATTSRI